ncbi:MAG: DUF1122 family protein [Actinomycetota bacterium]
MNEWEIDQQLLEGPAETLSGIINDKELDGYSLSLGDFKRGRTERESYFNLYLERGGVSSLRPVVQGLFFMGRGDYIRAWIEFRYVPRADFSSGGSVDLEDEGLTPGLISVLGDLVPPGGSMMIIYGAEQHAIHSETEWGLKRGFPPPATPLGCYLWGSGFRWFKDWYFSEGWMEGGMKLQATRPISEAVRRERQDWMREELSKFVAGVEGRELPPLEEAALLRARKVLASIPPAGSR